MNRFLVKFYFSADMTLTDIRQTDMNIEELHEEIIKAMNDRCYYEIQSQLMDSSRMTLLWNHLLYFEIQFIGYEGTQPINLNVEDEE